MNEEELKRAEPGEEGRLGVRIDPFAVRFDERGLVPVVMRDASRRRVLMLAYMNRGALEKTVETGELWLWSRSRGELWNKGATSGNRQRVVSLSLDCDADAILVDVEPLGPACHTGAYSCFEDDAFDLGRLQQVVHERKLNMPENSYVAKLFARGRGKMLKKIGEEATEVVIAASMESRERLVEEAADLLFHLMVLLESEGTSLAEVEVELARRHK